MTMDIMKRIRVVLVASAIILLNSCIFNSEVEHKINRTVLVYIGADNNLSNTANSNIYSMNSCISSGMDNYNLLVFVDRKDVAPALLHVHDFKIDTVAKYPERDTSDPMILREVIDDVVQNWKAEHYGLVMWSHGTGWLPTNMLHYVAPNMNYSPMHRAFSWEDRKGQKPAYSCMELEGLAEAIPDDVFDFIVFDACYMGNVEIAYALRNKTPQIVSSCYEIVSYGFPYHIVTRDLLNGNVLKSCNEFYRYYNSMNGWEQMAGISLVKTEGLDSLARCFRKIIAEYGDTIQTLDVSDIQCFDRFTHHVFFDLEDFVETICPDSDYLNEFRLQLDQCVPYHISTPYIFPGDREEIKVNSYCGLSVYIPLPEYDESGLNEAYRKTEWSNYTDY